MSRRGGGEGVIHMHSGSNPCSDRKSEDAVVAAGWVLLQMLFIWARYGTPPFTKWVQTCMQSSLGEVIVKERIQMIPKRERGSGDWQGGPGRGLGDMHSDSFLAEIEHTEMLELPQGGRKREGW